jgi:hypothetical protein
LLVAAAACGGAQHGDSPSVFTCDGRQLVVRYHAPHGGGWETTLSCADGGAPAVASSRLGTPRTDGGGKLAVAEFERAWKEVEATHWRSLSEECSDPRRPEGEESPTYQIVVRAGTTVRDFACATALLPSPLDRLAEQAQLASERIPADAWKDVEPPPVVDEGMRIGVPECDEFMSKYLACIDSKMPAAAIETTRDALRETVQAWKQAATTPEGRAALANACKQMMDSTRQATAAMGCKW